MKPFAFSLGVLAICVIYLPGCSGETELAGQAQQEKKSDDGIRNEPATKESSVASTEKDPPEEPIDLNQRVVPPQVIAGSYLTCSFSDDINSLNRAVYGCTARAADGNRLDLADVKVEWGIAASANVNIDAIEIIPPVAMENHHRYWSVIAGARSMQLSPVLTLYDAEGLSYQVLQKGVVTVQ